MIPSNHTGAQTAKKKKAGSRVTSKYAFAGEGTTVSGDSTEDKRKIKGGNFGKQAGRFVEHSPDMNSLMPRIVSVRGRNVRLPQNAG